MEEESFYVHLCSTDSVATYPTNSCSNFTNLLAKPIDLSRGYEVAVIEMQYTNSLYNVTANSNFGLFDFLHEWKTTENSAENSLWGQLHNANVPEGQYDDVEDFCDILNRLVDQMNIDRLKGYKIFTYDKISKKFHINVANKFLTIIVKDHLINILGLAKKESTLYQVAIIGKSKDAKSYVYEGHIRYFKNQNDHWKSDSETGGVAFFPSQMVIVSSLLLYSPILADVMFGSSFVRLLRVVPVTGKSNERIVHSFERPIYLPVKESFLSYIGIEIRDYSGQPVNFLTDNIYLLLHFRLIKR